MEDATPFLYNNQLHIFHHHRVYKLENDEWETVATLEDQYISGEKALVVEQKILSWL